QSLRRGVAGCELTGGLLEGTVPVTQEDAHSARGDVPADLIALVGDGQVEMAIAGERPDRKGHRVVSHLITRWRLERAIAGAQEDEDAAGVVAAPEQVAAVRHREVELAIAGEVAGDHGRDALMRRQSGEAEADRGGALEGPIPEPQVNSIRSCQVELAIAVEV